VIFVDDSLGSGWIRVPAAHSGYKFMIAALEEELLMCPLYLRNLPPCTRGVGINLDPKMDVSIQNGYVTIMKMFQHRGLPSKFYSFVLVSQLGNVTITRQSGKKAL
jgi:hypothetical protein